MTAENTMNMMSAMPTTHSVLRVWCTTTLSITTWVKSGVASATSWMASEASSTSRQIFLCLSNSGMNHLKPKG